MKRIICCLFCTLGFLCAYAGKVTGIVTDTKGAPLPYASISVKGTNKGAVANGQGRYSLQLDAGSYTLVCRFVGYRAEEKKIRAGEEELTLNFELAVQELTMEEVVIKRGEDPAIEIMRETIRKRDFYNKQVDSFTVEVYIKGLLRSRGLPQKFMGQTIDRKDLARDGIDSAGHGILFLSESQTRVAFKQPDKLKYEVISSRQSGGGYGISFPFFINFYTNNVSVFDNRLNPRGFVSPISDNAFHYYKFRYEGNFFEGNKMIDKIRVTPKRKNEPLFNGYVQIVDGEWRLHSLELTTTSDYGLELLDTIRITQQHSAVTADIWRTQNQVLYVAVKKFGFDITGNFLNVYSNYDLTPAFGKKYFNRIVMSYDTAFNKKDSGYWNRVRPVALEQDEKRDFVFKDSMSRQYRDSLYSRRNVDSLRKARKPVRLKDILLNGVSYSFYSQKNFANYHLAPLLKKLEYNTVEGLAIKVEQRLGFSPRRGRRALTLDLNTRYGLSNQHLNAFALATIRPFGDRWRNRYLSFGGGKRIVQINQDGPIDPLTNTLYTLLDKKNYMKLYENWFGRAEYNNHLENGLRYNIQAVYEDRIPLVNTADYSFFKKSSALLPNHPYELANVPFEPHQALVAAVEVSYQPGQRYIQYPTYKVPIGSSYPTFALQYAKGLPDLFGSDVDFDKWRFSVYDDVNLKLGGEFRYRFSVGGFLNNSRVGLPDYQHFNGNQTFYNIKYLNSFQLAPYYQYSNIEKLYAVAHVEHHFNGLITNKIPLFNKLKWNLVGGANTFYVNRDNYYLEAFAGLENILKLFRVDFVAAYQSQPGSNFGVRVGLGGILGGMVRFND